MNCFIILNKEEAIKQQLDQLMLKYHDNNFELNSKADLIELLSHIYFKINIIRPFMTENSLVSLQFLKEVINYLNNFITFGCFDLDFSKITYCDKKYLLNGTVEAKSNMFYYLNTFFKKMLKDKAIEAKTL